MGVCYYYNQDILQQLYLELVDNKVIDEISSKETVKIGVKAKLFAILGIETNGVFSHNTKESVPRIKHTQDTISKLTTISLDSTEFPSDKNCVYAYNGEMQISNQFCDVEKSMFAQIKFKIGKYTLVGRTSKENWTSKSVLNMILVSKSFCGSILFQRLDVGKKSNQPIQVLSLSAWGDEYE